MFYFKAADKYTLTVKAQDLDGSTDGYATTSTVTISVLDVNDNLPTLEMEKVEFSLIFVIVFLFLLLKG